ncbi:MAG: hypothetical protein Q8K86_08170 [Candidatus Nanopelagicaceae bacterium]|nr:hypothetical protein [Candidatus Nanopelagicaceae bacterium]
MKLDRLYKLKHAVDLFEAKQTVIDLVDDLTKRMGIPAMIVGGAALPTHGFDRLTKDIDLVTTVSDAQRLGDALLENDFKFIGGNTFKRNDSELKVNLCPESIKTHPTGKLGFPPTENKTPGLHVVSLPRLMAMKISAGRLKDRTDYMELIKINHLDRKWIDENVMPLLTNGKDRRWATEFWNIAQKEKKVEDSRRNVLEAYFKKK